MAASIRWDLQRSRCIRATLAPSVSSARPDASSAANPGIGLGTEVRHVDHQRIALPATARVAVPLAYLCWQVRAPVHDDVALPPLPLTDVVIDRHTAWRLHDPAEATVVGSEFR